MGRFTDLFQQPVSEPSPEAPAASEPVKVEKAVPTTKKPSKKKGFTMD